MIIGGCFETDIDSGELVLPLAIQKLIKLYFLGPLFFILYSLPL